MKRNVGISVGLCAALVLLVATPAHAAIITYVNSVPKTQNTSTSSASTAGVDGARGMVEGTGGGYVTSYINNYRTNGPWISGSSAPGWQWAVTNHPQQSSNVRSWCYWNASLTLSGTINMTCQLKTAPGDFLVATDSSSARSVDGASSVSDESIGSTLDSEVTVTEALSDYERCVTVTTGDYSATGCTTTEDFQKRGVAISLNLPSGSHAAYVLPEPISEGTLEGFTGRIAFDDSSDPGSFSGRSGLVKLTGASGAEYTFPDLVAGAVDIPRQDPGRG